MHFKKKSANVKINFLFPEPFSVEVNSPVRVWGGGACFKKDLNSSSLPGLKKKADVYPWCSQTLFICTYWKTLRVCF